jgi:hypothetical protein
MGTTPTAPEDRAPVRPTDAEPFVAVVTEGANGETRCSISPPPTSERRVESEWVAADAGSFVSLPAIR